MELARVDIDSYVDKSDETLLKTVSVTTDVRQLKISLSYRAEKE